MNRVLTALLVLIIIDFAGHSSADSQWVQTNGPTNPVWCLASKDGDVFAGTAGSGIFISSDIGISWHSIDSGLTDTSIFRISVHGSSLFVGTPNEGGFMSTNNGVTWFAMDSILTGKSVRAFAFHDSVIYVGTFKQGVFRSTDLGLSWAEKDSGLTSHGIPILGVYCFFLDSTGSGAPNIIAGTEDGTFASTDEGNSWHPLNSGMEFSSVIDISLLHDAFDSSLYFAATGSSVTYASTNHGATWISMGNGMGTCTSFALSGSNLFAGSFFGGVYLFNDSSRDWQLADSGLPSSNAVEALAISNGYLFAGTANGIWRRPLSEMITSVDDDSRRRSPMEFSLDQNFPEPFNPSTTIRYDIPTASHVSMKIYNLLGQTVSTLTEGIQQPGEQSDQWNAAGFSSGVYFYRLEAASLDNPVKTFTQVRKMVLMK